MKKPILVNSVDVILRAWWLTGCEKKQRGGGFVKI